MKIAINCSYYIPKGGGIKEYIYNLVKHINIHANDEFEFIYYIAKGHEDFWIKTMPEHLRFKATPYNSSQPIKRSLFQQKFWYKEEREEQFDIFHSPFLYSPKFKKAKILLTVHDLRFKVFPETYTFLRARYLDYKVPRSLKKAELIICISEFTKSEVIKHFKISKYKIQVIHEAVNFETFNSKNQFETDKIKQSGLEANNFILAVGHVEPRKNYVRLIKAIDKINFEFCIDLKLVIVGKTSFKSKDSINTINKSKHVLYLDFVEFSELLWLYNNCKFHVFPSIYEGFGFPSLEAGIFGKPTVGSNASSIPEITGDGGIYFNPFSIDEIVSQIMKLYSDNELLRIKSIAAKENLERFNWRNNAIQTLQLYQKLI